MKNNINLVPIQEVQYWPSVNDNNVRKIYLNDNDAYTSGAFVVIWSCFGEVDVLDERPSFNVYKAYFFGSPDIKAVVLNSDKLNDMEEDFKKRGAEGSKRFIDERSIEEYGRRGLLEWKYI